MDKMRIGVISDTHGLLRKEAIAALKGVDLIIHAGDVGSPVILQELGQITRVVAVRGNNDHAEWAERLPVTEYLEFAGLNIYVIHDLQNIDIEPQAAGIDLVISGHTHKTSKKNEKGVTYLNPGSAGPRRFNLPNSVAVIQQSGRWMETEFITF